MFAFLQTSVVADQSLEYKRRRNSQETTTTQTTPSPSHLPSQILQSRSEAKSFKELAVKALGHLAEKDEFGAFGDHLAAELRSLTAWQAAFAKRKLARSLVDVMDEAVLMVSIIMNIKLDFT